VPADQVKVTVDPERVLPGLGAASAAGAVLAEAAAGIQTTMGKIRKNSVPRPQRKGGKVR
jgi:hypothetical protein